MRVQVAVHGKPFGLEDSHKIELFFIKLAKSGLEPIVSTSFLKACIYNNLRIVEGFETYSVLNDLKNAQYAFSFGGDGTLLEMLTHIGKHQIPIIGINMGRLGFLATTPLEHIDQAIDSLIANDFEIDKRVMLKMESDNGAFGNKNFALNDFTILKKDTSSMIKVKAFLNGIYLNAYWADGLIVSTPTGSTGYSLSCGGPLVLPQSANFIITPVSPHNLNVRPLVFSDHGKITFEIETRSNNVLITLDSRSMSVSTDIKMVIKKDAKIAKLVKFKNYSQFETMRNKLNWGIDFRN